MASYQMIYYNNLRYQIEINRDQLNELMSLLFVEKVKLLVYFTFILLLLGFAIFVGFAVAGGIIDYRSDHYAALINIGAVFLLFGIFELLAFLTDSLSLSAKLRRLIARQKRSLIDADEELAYESARS